MWPPKSNYNSRVGHIISLYSSLEWLCMLPNEINNVVHNFWRKLIKHPMGLSRVTALSTFPVAYSIERKSLVAYGAFFARAQN
jgi:hypothetical protein